MRKTFWLFHFKSQQPEQFFCYLGRMKPWSEKTKFRVSRTNKKRGTFQLGLRPKQNITTKRCFFWWFWDFRVPSHPPSTKHKTCNFNPPPLPFGPSSPTTSWPLLSCPGAVQVIFGSTSLLFGRNNGQPVFGATHHGILMIRRKGQSWHNPPKRQNEEPYQHHTSMNMQIFNILTTHVPYKFQFSVFKFLMHTSRILYFCTTNKQVTTTHIITYQCFCSIFPLAAFSWVFSTSPSAAVLLISDPRQFLFGHLIGLFSPVLLGGSAASSLTLLS